MSNAEVGFPTWSATTPTSSRVSLSLQHRANEIRAERAIDPGGAQNDVVFAALGDEPFADELGAAVSPDRAGRIILPIGPSERAVEHVVGREMQKRNAEPRGGLRHMTRPFAVDPNGDGLLRFRLVDCRIGCGVDHNVRARVFESGEHGAAVLEVERGPAERNNRNPWSRAFDQRSRHLALRSGDRDPHHSNSSRASLSRGQRRSLSERTGPPAGARQSMAMSGSSQARPRSWAGE